MIQTIVRSALLAALLVGVAFADPIVLTFTGPGSGLAGTSVTLFGTATNTSGTEQSLDGLSFTFVSPFMDFDDTAFFTTWPLVLDAAGPGASFGPAAMFDVAIPFGTPTGNYTGNIVNVYGGGGTLLLTSQSFDITVADTGVPEPATTCLVAGGIAALALVRKRRNALGRQTNPS